MKRTFTRQRITRAAATLAAPRRALVLALTLIAALTVQTAWADTWPEYITDVVLAGGTESEAASVKNSSTYSGYTWCSTSLNNGTNGDVIYIGYKKSSSPAYINGGYITDFVVVETGSSHNPSSTFSLNGKTYYLCPTAGGDYFANTNHGNLTSRCSGGWNIYLYYTKDNFDDKRAVDGITIYSVNDINDHRSEAINCYNTNGTLKEGNISLNRGVSNTPYVYMHINTVTKTNRPSADPVMASGLVYNGSALQLIKTGATLASGTMYYRLGTSGEWTSNVADIKATTQGYYTVYYYASSTSYCNQSVISESHAKTTTIAMSPNNGVTVSCSNYLEGTTPVPSLGGTNLSTGAVTYKYCTSQNGTYTTTVPVEPGTYWVKATVYGDDNCYDYTTAPVSFTITYNWKLHNSGNTEDDAYVISTTTDLKYLAVWVNGGNNFEGKFFKLGDNIALDKSKENNFTPIGNANYSFSGTFDGQGYTISGLNINKPNNNNVGLFGRANNATIKNLKLDNCTITGKESTGAIVGLGGDNVTITNCRVTNSVTVSGTSYVGGIVGQNANVIGCASAATVSGSSNYVGGIIGNSNSNTIANSLYTGTNVSCSGNNKGAIVGSNTNTTLTVNYYTADLTIGGVNGSDTNGARRAVAINTADGVTVTPTGTVITYNVSGITTYADNQGMIYSDTFYAGATETVSLDIAYDIESFSLTGYTDGNGNTLTHVSDNTYTLTMTANASTVTPVGSDLWGEALSDCDGTAEHPYLITTPAGLDLLASKVNGGTNYSGKYFELGADITYGGTTNNYTPIGTGSKAFSGHFDGKGHTVSGINIVVSTESYKGLFGRIVSAEVKNLTLDNSRIVGRDYCGGISGYNYQGTISNCHVTSSVTIHGSYGNARYHGGITGYNNQSSIIGCTSGADVTAASNVSNTDQYGGIAGYNTGGTIEDCLVYGGSITTSSNIAGTVVGKYHSGTLTNNHYSGVTLNGSEAGLDKGVGEGSQDGTAYACAIIPYEGVTLNVATGEVTTTYDYDGLKIYPTGMSYGGTWYNYIANGANISGDVTFTATYTGSVPKGYALSGFGSTSIADNPNVSKEWAATDGSATCTLCTDVATIYYIAPTFNELPTVELADHNEYNSSVIVANQSQTCNVVLKDRTLYKDGKWNTICLPFNVDMTDPNGPLYGATYRTVTDASISGTTLNITFAEKPNESFADNTLTAGTPYIIKWDKADDYVDDDAHNIVNPVFNNVNPENVGVDYWNGDETSNSTVAFLGTYDAIIDIANNWADASVNGAGKPLDVLLLGADNTLRYAGSGASLGACRAYFLVDPASVEAGASRLTSFSIDFGEGEATAIKEIGNSQSSNRKSPDVWYSLNGVRLSGKPTQRGIYINNGKKVVIK